LAGAFGSPLFLWLQVGRGWSGGLRRDGGWCGGLWSGGGLHGHTGGGVNSQVKYLLTPSEISGN